MEIILSIIVFLSLSIIALEFAAKLRNNNSTHFLINFDNLKKSRTFRAKILKKVLSHYMAFDANLGLRMKANCQPFRYLHRMKGKKKFKEIKLNNFFEIRTDNYGFICNNENESQNRNYKEIAQDSSIFRILITGNSVSAGSGTAKGSQIWSSILEKKLNDNLDIFAKKYKQVIVINSSSLGHKLSHEFRRFVDETFFLNPHMVLTLSGGLAGYTYNGNPLDEENHDLQNKVTDIINSNLFLNQKIYLPNIVNYLRSRPNFVNNETSSYPYRKDNYITTTAAELTLAKIKQFDGICSTSNIDFLFFFQPVLGVGKKILSKEELKLTEQFESYFFDMNWDEYLEKFTLYSDQVRRSLDNNKFYDFMDIFADTHETVYKDPRHQNELGHKIFAETISKIVIEKLKIRYKQLEIA